MTTDAPKPVRRALLSVSDKSGLADLARALAARGVELLSTGGTARTLREAGLEVTDVSSVTGFPEILGGRVKTLHPKVHGGILARHDDADHQKQMAEHGIEPIDLVVINLYPFEQTIARAGVSEPEAIEQIDIGGPAMVRASAKNFESVCLLTDAGQYEGFLAQFESSGGTTRDYRRARALDAFIKTSAYDRAIAGYLAGSGGADDAGVELRYGENPHQSARAIPDASYAGPSVLHATQHAGKQLSYNNLLDADAALELVLALHAFDPAHPAACVVKHTNPCGAAAAGTAADAVRLAIAGDPMAAYGGILASSVVIDAAAGEALVEAGSFFEVIVAPGFDEAAARTISGKWKNCRLLEVSGIEAGAGLGAGLKLTGESARTLRGGKLVQERDTLAPNPEAWTHHAGPEPTDEQTRAAGVLECAVRSLSSNAVCLGGPDHAGVRLFGAGAGQMDRVASCRLAIEKAGDLSRGSIALSDAFFPFPDGPALLADAGVAMIVHPGGSKRDQETFDLCAERGITCMTTGVRHFRH